MVHLIILFRALGLFNSVKICYCVLYIDQICYFGLCADQKEIIMSIDITIGEVVLKYGDSYYAGIDIIDSYDGRVFGHSPEMFNKSNHRMFNISGFFKFCDRLNLDSECSDIFSCTDDTMCGEPIAFDESMLLTVSRKLDSLKSGSLDHLYDGFSSELKDVDISRLEWFCYWMLETLKRCDRPGIDFS